MRLVWSAQEVLRTVRGQNLHPQDWVSHGVSIDSRTISAGDLFIAIKGPSLDGHDYVRAAIDAGAVAAIVDHHPPHTPPDAPLVFVDDTMKSLETLGREGRERSKAQIVAVTGSVGKTSTKEQLRLMLGAVNDTFANEGSLNNHWGVPLTLARLPETAKFGVIEMGMNHAGELAPLSRVVRPHVALITNIEAVHLEHFTSLEAIADAKAEIFCGMDSSGIAVLNADNPQYARLREAARAQGLKKILSFGRDSKCDARLLNITTDNNGTTIEASLLGKQISYTMGVVGEHLAFNALGALLACAALDVDLSACIEALASYRPPSGRGTRERIQLATGGTVSLIDETFNASPVATHAAIHVLGQTQPDAAQGRRIAVLGDMRELGETAPTLHADLADSLLKENIDVVYCCGELMSHLYNALPPSMRGGFAMDSAGLSSLVASELQAGDVIMIKGSHSMHMEKVVTAIRETQHSQKIAS